VVHPESHNALQLHGQGLVLLHEFDPTLVQTTRCVGPETEGTVGMKFDTGNLDAPNNYVRFHLHELLPEVDRIVYLDSDLVVLGDVAELLQSMDGSNATVAAVPRLNNVLQVYIDVFLPKFPRWVPSESPSFNAGVMVINLQAWRSRQVTARIEEWVAENKKNRIWRHGSQPAMLLVFHDEVHWLDWQWNVDGLGHRLNYPQEVLQDAKILHWTGPLKPWLDDGVNRLLWEPHTMRYCPLYSNRHHTTTCRPDSWFC